MNNREDIATEVRNSAAEVGNGDQNVVSGNNNQPNREYNKSLDLKSAVDSSAMRYFNEVYPDERQARLQDDANGPSRNGEDPKTFLQILRSAKKDVEIGLKGISFEKLREDSMDQNTLALSTENIERNLPTNFQEEQTHNSDLKFPLDDDFGATEECHTSNRLENRSDSYNNVYDTSEHIENDEKEKNSQEHPKWKVIFSEDDEENSSKSNKDGINSRKDTFGYGSREYLDQLEGAAAIIPKEKTSKKKRSKSLKADKSIRDRSKRSENGRTHGKSKTSRSSSLVETIHEVDDSDMASIKSRNINKLSENVAQNGISAVQNAIQEGFISYKANTDENSSDAGPKINGSTEPNEDKLE